MYDLNATNPTPDDLATRTEFTKVKVPLMRLFEAAQAEGLTLDGRRFVDCVIHGPCVIIPGRDTQFEQSSLGDAGGDVRNLFLRAAGPMITGAIPINNCVFNGCIFIGVGFAGSDAFVDQFSANLVGKRA